MAYLNIDLPPPQNWQDFEIMMKGVAEVIWRQHGWHHQGRAGQSQAGIDLWGYDNNYRFIGIKCKRKTITNADGVLLDHSLLGEEEIKYEVALAEKIDHTPLNEMIFATTAASDVKIQNFVRKLSYQRTEEDKFAVSVWFWEDIAAHINRHEELLNWYYENILKNMKLYDKDRHILYTIRTAFKRPAFRCHLRSEESGGDFLQAIKDTQEVINTGKLYNRRGDLLETAYAADQLSNPAWIRDIEAVEEKLGKVRDIYRRAVKANKIVEHPSCLDVRDDRVGQEIDLLRKDALVLLNKVLHAKGLETVSCDLVY